MNFQKHKPTFFSISPIIGIVLGIPFGLYALSLKGGASLGGVVIYSIVIGLAIILAIDRVLVYYCDYKKISIIEFILTTLLITLYYINQD